MAQTGRLFTYNGMTQSLVAWARTMGIKRGTLYKRVVIDGMSFAQALAIPVRSRRRPLAHGGPRAGAIDLTGHRFGRLIVEGFAQRKRYPSGQVTIYWRCRCQCGNTCLVQGNHLRADNTRSCGCGHYDGNRLWWRGERHSFKVWEQTYGLSPGILSNRLAHGWSIQRALLTPVHVSRQLTYDGDTLTLQEWSRRTGIPHSTLHWRYTQGWAPERILARTQAGEETACTY